MCDPVTVLVQTANLTRALGEAITSVAAFVTKVKHIDETTQALKEELSSLRRVVRAIESYLDSPQIEQYGKIPFLEDMEDCLKACCTTVGAFTSAFQGLHPKDEKWTIRRGSVRAIKHGWKESTLVTLRAQFLSHNSAMQIILQVISFHIVTNKPNRAGMNLNKRLDTLTATISEGQAHDKHISHIEVAHPILQSNKRLRDCATSMVSQASVLGSTWSQTGSEYGQPLSVEGFQRTKAWISTNTGNQLAPPNNKMTSSSTATSQIDGLFETLGIGLYNESLKSLVEEEDDDATAKSDDGEDDFHPIKLKNYLEFGQEKFEAGTYHEAEYAFRQALDLWRSLGQDRAKVDEIDILLKIARTCLKRNKLEEAESLCKLISSRLKSTNPPDSRALDASFILAQVFYRQGANDLAIKECERCRGKRIKATGQIEASFECIALLVTIYKAQKNMVDATVNAKSLPHDYQFPVFNGPDESASSSTSLKQSQLSERANEDLLVDISEQECSSEALKEYTSISTNNTKQLINIRTSRTGEHNSSRLVTEPQRSGRGNAELSLRASRDSGVFTQMSDQSVNPKKVSVVSQSDPKGRTSTGTLEGFFSAIEKCQVEVVSAFLTGAISLKGSKMFGVFSSKGNDAHLRKLATAVNHVKLNAVHLAAKLGYRSLLELFFQYNFTMIHNSDAWGTPLHLAAKFGHAPAVEFLLNKGAKPDVVTTTRNYTPLQQAARYGHDEVVKLLVERGADVNFGHPHSALHLAAELGSMSSVKLLVEANAPVNSLDNNHRSALHYAARSGHHDVVSFLIESNASLNIRDDENQRGSTPLDYAIRYDRVDIVRLLLKMGVDAKSADSIGYTPLHLAAEHGRSEIVVMLIRHRVPLDCCDKKGYIPLQLADANKHYGIARLLTVPDDGRNERY